MKSSPTRPILPLAILLATATICPLVFGQTIPAVPPEIVSAWKLDAGNVVVIFRHDGVFYFIDGEAGHSGMERGTFEWNKTSGVFSANVVVDTNTDAGFSDPEGATTITVSGNTLTYNIAGFGSFPFTRIVNTASAIVGSWHLPGQDANLTFLADGTYYHSEESYNDLGSTTGMERGTYTWSSGTGALFATPLTDTNGDIGLSDPAPSYNASISGNVMTLVEGAETYTLRRITPILAPLNTQNDFEVDKFANYRQTSASAPSPLPGPPNDDQPFWGEAYIEDSVSGSGGTMTITGQAARNFVNDFGWGIETEYSSLTALNAASAFPNGANYVFSRTGGAATLSYPANGTFPPAPVIVGGDGNGTWSNGQFILGENQTLIWSAHTAYDPSTLVTVLSVVDQGTQEEIFYEEVIQGDIASYDFRGKLIPGRSYDVQLEHVKIAGSTAAGTGPFAGKLGYALYNSNTRFTMAMPTQHVEVLYVKKRVIARQQSATALAPPEPTFDATVEGYGITATFPSATITLTKPGGFSIPLVFDEDHWDAEEVAFPSLNALQSAFPNGIYGINIGSDSIQIDMSASNFPNQPLIASTAGTWVDGKLRITASQAATGFILTSNNSIGNSTVRLSVFDADYNDIVYEKVETANVSANVAPGQLAVGVTYTAEVEFNELIDSGISNKSWGSPPNGRVEAFGLLSSETFLTIEVVADAPSEVEFVIAVKDVRHFQTGPSTVILDPTPVSPTNGGPFGFGAAVQGQNMASLPAPTVSPPPGTPSSPQDPFYSSLFFNTADDELSWRYGPDANDWGDITQAGIDARFPNGTYTFLVDGVSVPLSLTGNSYPNIPQMTLTGGSWINGKYAMDAANALTVTTNTFTGYGANADGRIGLGVNDSGVEFFRSSSPSTNFATYSVPANTLPPNEITVVDAEFGAIVDKSNAIPGAYCAALYERQLKLEVHILPKIITQSSSRTFNPGDIIDFQVTATGSPATVSGSLNYQWKKNGIDVPGLTSSSFGMQTILAIDAGTYTCTVSNDVGTVTSLPIYLELADSFQSYAASFGLNSVTTGAPDADFDKDGVPTLLEYLLGGNPTLPSSGLLPAVTKAPGSNNVVFTYKRKLAAAGVTQVIEHTTNLSATWTSAVHGAGGVTIGTTAVPGDASSEQVTVTIPSTSTTRFVRLKASRP